MRAEPDERPRGSETLLRGWLVALAATVPAACLHGAAHGTPTSPIAIAVVFALAGAICVRLVGKKWSRMRSAVAVLLAQAGYHTVFSLAPAHGAGVSAAAQLHQHDHHLHDPLATSAALRSQLAESSTSTGAQLDLVMTLAHLVAALVTVGVIWYGHAVLRAAASWATELVVTALALTRVLVLGLCIPNLRLPRAREAVVRLKNADFTQLIQGRAPPVAA